MAPRVGLSTPLPMTTVHCFPVGSAWPSRRGLRYLLSSVIQPVFTSDGSLSPFHRTQVYVTFPPSLLTGWGLQHRCHVKAWPQSRWRHFLWISPACSFTVVFLNVFRDQLLSRQSRLQSLSPAQTLLPGHQNTEASFYPRLISSENGGRRGMGWFPAGLLES